MLPVDYRFQPGDFQGGVPGFGITVLPELLEVLLEKGSQPPVLDIDIRLVVIINRVGRKVGGAQEDFFPIGDEELVMGHLPGRVQPGLDAVSVQVLLAGNVESDPVFQEAADLDPSFE